MYPSSNPIYRRAVLFFQRVSMLKSKTQNTTTVLKNNLNSEKIFNYWVKVKYI